MANPDYLTASKTIFLSSYNLAEANYNAYPSYLIATKTISLSSLILAEA